MTTRDHEGGEDLTLRVSAECGDVDQTIKATHAKGLAYDIETPRLPTETITHGGRRVIVDEEGGYRDGPPAETSDYEVVESISVGGMGAVYAARQHALQREVAVKICRTGGPTDPSQSVREVDEFANEAYVTASLDHPHVVPIYALARDAEGRPFFTMKRVSGMSWKGLLHPDTLEGEERTAAEARARQMAWDDHLDILLKVCDAVAYAHSKKVLHRDLKPENIMLGDYGEVYVMDWGLAIYCDERNEYRQDPDLPPEIAGTPSYMAPEMARAEMTTFCEATDIYLLGGLLYELLTGGPPHRGRTVSEVVELAAQGEVAPPAEVCDSARINASITKIVMKALAPCIEDRYASVREFQGVLREYRAHSESLVVQERAATALDELKGELMDRPDAEWPAIRSVEKEDGALAYGRLSECIGSFRQALALWNDNWNARRGLLDAMILQIRLAVQQGDVTLARAQCSELSNAAGEGPEFIQEVHGTQHRLGEEIREKQEKQSSVARQARWAKGIAAALILCVIGGVAAVIVMSNQQRDLALRSEEQMFVAAVRGCADMVDAFMVNIERVAQLYRQEADELMAISDAEFPNQPLTPAGRQGFYYDEDYYDPATRPPDMHHHDWYGSAISLSEATVVRAPWARSGEPQLRAEADARRLARLSSLFSKVHRTRTDVPWSLAGTRTGLLVGFPGSGRYRDKPDYDPTLRAWYLAAIDAPDDQPVWGDPYSDASTRQLIISCMCRIRPDGQNVGVVGLEVTLKRVQTILMEFSRSSSEPTRCLLIKAFEETDPETGGQLVTHRAVVDTRYRTQRADWRETLNMARVEEAGEGIAEYCAQVVAGTVPPSQVVHSHGQMMAYARLPNHDWTLVVTTRRNANDPYRMGSRPEP